MEKCLQKKLNCKAVENSPAGVQRWTTAGYVTKLKGGSPTGGAPDVIDWEETQGQAWLLFKKYILSWTESIVIPQEGL